ncbi:MAG: alginate O-acetyltransferase AlgF [Spirochaetota bacterium]
MSLQQPARRIHVPYLVLVALALTAPAATAQADDAGVYGPAAPEDAGFVRVFNGDPSEAVELPIGPRRYGPVAFGEVTAYRPIRAGVFLLRSGGEEAEIVVRPDTYTTVLIGPGEITVISDERHDDPARAQLVLYNAAAEGDVDLVVLPDGPPVFRDVAAGESRARALNAVTVELGLRTGDDVAVDLEPVDLTRGNSFAVFAVSAETGLAARIHEARVVVDD